MTRFMGVPLDEEVEGTVKEPLNDSIERRLERKK